MSSCLLDSQSRMKVSRNSSRVALYEGRSMSPRDLSKMYTANCLHTDRMCPRARQTQTQCVTRGWGPRLLARYQRQIAGDPLAGSWPGRPIAGEPRLGCHQGKAYMKQSKEKTQQREHTREHNGRNIESLNGSRVKDRYRCNYWKHSQRQEVKQASTHSTSHSLGTSCGEMEDGRENKTKVSLKPG